ncbi:MAG: acetylxylan esterase [Planctomycetaceae bacterium]|nr:acetylxylan esterase [Planctomycetaceae bacterium]
MLEASDCYSAENPPALVVVQLDLVDLMELFEFLDYVKSLAAEMRKGDAPAATLEEWKQAREQLRQRLIENWGGFPETACDLDPQKVGEFQREGYRVERLHFQTRPGIRMTANAYVPDKPGRHPAVLSVHGHWQLAKSQPEIQSRCIGLAKLGFFVLMVDAFGAGERGIGKALGEYHGEMVAGTLWPTGLPLAGLQVYENSRAVDYLQARPEVDPNRIGITGASGGGNQTMYAGAMDDRLKCVVPVCSVGTYQAYLGAACCMCEVTPGALSHTEEGAILSLVAPRGLMLINATRDAFQFSVGEGAKSLAFAKQVFSLYGKEESAKQAVFESGHGYNQPMREAMYGWMTLHLKGEGTGEPIPEPAHDTEEAETLRCFPNDSRPDDFITLPQFAAAEGKRLVGQISIPTHAEQWRTQEIDRITSLVRMLGPFPKREPLNLIQESEEAGVTSFLLNSEPGIKLAGTEVAGTGRRVILLDFDDGRKSISSDWAKAFIEQKATVVSVDLRATGTQAWSRDKIGRAPDHNTAEWSLWLGRPLLAQWVWDVARVLHMLDEQRGDGENIVVGVGPAGLVALMASALITRIHRVAMVGTLASFVTDVPYENQRLGTLVPGILRDVGDIPHIAATVSPRPLIISQATSAVGKPLTLEETEQLFKPATTAYNLENVATALQLHGELTPAQLAERLLS